MGLTAFTQPSLLDDEKALKDFRSGRAEVDAWAKNHAAHAIRTGTAAVYVSRCGDEVAGFYTLSSYTIARSDIADRRLARNTPTRVPATLLGMLGVASKYQSCGLGKMLLREAFICASKAARIVGSKALVVLPVDESVKTFYLKYGFKEVGTTGELFIPLF